MPDIKFNFLANTSQFKKALNEVSRGLSNIQAQADSFNKIASSFQSVGKSLTKYVTLPLAAAGTGLVAAFNVLDKAFDTIRIGTGATGEQLEELDAAFRAVAKAVPNSIEEIGTAIANLNTMLGLNGDLLIKTAIAVLNLSDMLGEDLTGVIETVAQAINKWNIDVSKTPELLDHFFKVSQQTGISVAELADSLARNENVLSAFGLSIEEAATYVGLLHRNGIDTTRMLVSLRQLIGNTAGGAEEVAKVFAKLRDKTVDENEKLKLINGLLSKVAATSRVEFADALRVLIDETENLNSTIASSSETIQKARKDTWDFAESFKNLKNNILLAVEPLANDLAKVIEDITPAITSAVKVIAKLGEAFANLPKGVKTAIIVLAGVLTILGPMLWAIGGLLKAIPALAAAFGSATAAVSGVAAALSGLAGVALPVIGIIGGLIGAVYGIKKALDKTKKANKDFVNDVLINSKKLGKAFDYTAKQIDAATTNIAIDIQTKLGTTTDITANDVGGALNDINKDFKTTGDAIGTTLDNTADDVVGNLEEINENLEDTSIYFEEVSNEINTNLEGVSSTFDLLNENVASNFEGINENTDLTVENIQEFADQVAENVLNVSDAIAMFTKITGINLSTTDEKVDETKQQFINFRQELESILDRTNNKLADWTGAVLTDYNDVQETITNTIQKLNEFEGNVIETSDITEYEANDMRSAIDAVWQNIQKNVPKAIDANNMFASVMTDVTYISEDMAETFDETVTPAIEETAETISEATSKLQEHQEEVQETNHLWEVFAETLSKELEKIAERYLNTTIQIDKSTGKLKINALDWQDIWEDTLQAVSNSVSKTIGEIDTIPDKLTIMGVEIKNFSVLVKNSLGQMAAATVQLINDLFSGSETAWEDFGKNLAQFVINFLSLVEQQIIAMKAAGIAAAIAQAPLTMGASLAQIPVIVAEAAVAIAAIEGTKAIIRGIAGLAEGGIVTQPTFAMIGEGGEPEAVIPLSKLEDILSDVKQSNEIHLHVGTLVADDFSLQELAEKLQELQGFRGYTFATRGG
jgi:TP901 family phage tail tape measure protein